MELQRGGRRLLGRGSVALAELVACVVFATAWMWPLVRHLATRLRDDGDCASTSWVVAWGEHALLSAPGNLFQSNCFAPAKDALAFSEPLLGFAVAGLPLRMLGGSPVLVHNLLFLLGLSISVWCVVRLSRRLGLPPAVAFAGALAAGSSAVVAGHLSHLVFTVWGLAALPVVAFLLGVDSPRAAGLT